MHGTWNIDQYRTDIMLWCVILRIIYENIPSTASVMDLLECIEKEFRLAKQEVSESFSRLVRGIEYIRDVYLGQAGVEKVFDERLSWATSLRALSIFVMNYEPMDALKLRMEDLPSRTNLLDYYSAVYLTGLYHDFTLLPVSQKQKWMNLLNVAISYQYGYYSEPTKIHTTWHDAETEILSVSEIMMADIPAIVLSSHVSKASVLRRFIDICASRVVSDQLSINEKFILRVVAAQNNYENAKTCSISYLRGIATEYEADKTRSVVAHQNNVDIKYGWDYMTIAETLSDSQSSSVSSEVFALVCQYLNYNYKPLIDTKAVKGTNIVAGWLRDHISSITFNETRIGYEEILLKDIHDIGIELLESLAALIESGAIDESQERRLMEILFYLTLAEDIIPEAFDLDIGLIDDWVVVSGAVLELFARPTKRKRKNHIDWVLLIADNLLSEVRSKFGDYFVEELLRKSGITK